MKQKTRKTVSVSLPVEDAEKLKKLFPYSSAFVSVLVHEFFRVFPVEEIWNSMGTTPLTKTERIARLQELVRRKVR